jgi:hypothetical protein
MSVPVNAIEGRTSAVAQDVEEIASCTPVLELDLSATTEAARSVQHAAPSAISADNVDPAGSTPSLKVKPALCGEREVIAVGRPDEVVKLSRSQAATVGAVIPDHVQLNLIRRAKVRNERPVR